jgi:hypothetical protein
VDIPEEEERKEEAVGGALASEEWRLAGPEPHTLPPTGYTGWERG